MSFIKRFLLIILTLSIHINAMDENRNINVQLHWKHQFQYAGFYAAIKQGYYKDAGLNVHLKEWDPSINKIDDLLTNKTDFLISASDVIGEVFKSKKLQIVSAYLQRTPVALAVKPDIYFPSELQNKKIMAVEKDIKSSVFYKMWESSKIDVDKLNIIPHLFSMDSFIKGDVDAVQIYVTDQLYELSSKNIKFNVINVNSYDVSLYDLMVVTSEKLTTTSPQLVQDFKDATTKGWKYALENKEELVSLIFDKYNTQNKSKEALLFEAKRLESFMLPNLYELGKIDPIKLKKIALLYLEMGKIENLNDIHNYYFSYKDFDRNLNLSVEEKAYLKNKKILNICTIPNKLSIDEQVFYKSIDIKIVEKIAQKLDIETKFIKTENYEQSVYFTSIGKCDILSVTRETPDRIKKLNISKPFLAQPLVMVASHNILFIDDFSTLKNKTIAISHEHMAIKTISNMYPNLKIVEVNSPKEALHLIKKEDIFGYIDIPIRIVHHIKQEGLLDLKIVGNLNIVSGLSIASTKKQPELASIIEKTMNLIPRDYINTLINEWYAITYEEGIDYTLVWQTIIAAFSILSLMLYWNQKVHRANKLLAKAQEELEVKNQSLKELSITDKLTKLWNRHKLDNSLNNEYNRFQRYGNTFGTILIDIDYFKKVNDIHGHQVGDTVLVEFSNILQNNIRETDILGRWGGEEFLIICIQSDLEATKKVAEKCRKAIESFEFSVVKHKTASFGIGMIHNNSSINELIERTDNNLYKAKETGRNKVVFE